MTDSVPRHPQSVDLSPRGEKLCWNAEVTPQEPLPPEQALLLLHELQVHQAELEMQNEELRRAQHELECSRARYFALYDQAPVGYLTLNMQGLILEANLTAATILGVERSMLSRKALSRFIHPADQDVYYLRRKQFLDKRTPQHGEIQMLHADGSVIWAELRESLSPSGECLVTLTDISARKQSETALRISETRYLSIIEDQTELICRYLPDGRLSFVNWAYTRYYGKSRSELINSNFVPTIPEPDLTLVLSSLAKITPDRPVASFTHRIIDTHGEIRWQRWTHRGIYAADGTISEYQAVGFDISDRKLTELITQAHLRINEYLFNHSLEELLTKVLDEAETITDSQIGFFHFVAADQETVLLQTWSSRTLTTICTAEGKGHRYPLAKAGIWGDCIRERKPVIHNEYAALPHRKGLPDGHTPIVREVVVPIFRNNLIVAVIGLGNKSTLYTQQDVETIQHLADLAWDIVERKRVEETLRSVSVYTRTLIEASPDPLVTISAEGQITDVNEASVRVTGVPRERLIGTDFSSYFTDPEKAREGYLRVFSDGVVHNYPLAIRHVSGGITDVLYNASIYRDEQGQVQGVFAAARDVTEQKRAIEALKQAHDELETRVVERTDALVQANEQMKRVSFELIWAEERERERIAGELHDQVGQSLLLAKMKLDALAYAVSSDPDQSSVMEASSLIETSLRDIRSLTFRMRPPILDTAGIETALQWLCSSIGNDYGLTIDFACAGQSRSLPPEVRYALYHAVRELLLNVVKHAKAKSSQLSVTSNENLLILQVQDDGVGFSHPDAPMKHVDNGGYGLYNVCQRVEQIGGSVTIDSAPGSGTSVTLTVPLDEN